MDLAIKGRKALITGGSKGIGLAICNSLKAEGCQVQSISRTDGYDLTQPEALHAVGILVQSTDILINNFGGGGTWLYKDADKVMQMNFGATFYLTMQYLQRPITWGRVITISSIYGREAGGNLAFSAAKAAQISLMNNLAGTVPTITFNTVCPGHIDVGKPFPYEPEIVGTPEDVAGVVTFLCSDLAKHINGACITVDGGFSKSV